MVYLYESERKILDNYERGVGGALSGIGSRLSVQIETRRADKRVKRNVEYGWGVGRLLWRPTIC